MSRTHIGGVLDYRLLTEQHRPTDYAVIASEAHRLSLSGLTARDIGQALQISPLAVDQMLRDYPVLKTGGNRPAA